MTHLRQTHAGLTLFALGLSGCLTEAPPSITAGEHEIAGVMGQIDWSIDVPWRLEPSYAAIPVTIAFHDGENQNDSEIGLRKTLRRFCGASIAHFAGTTPSDVRIQRKPPHLFHEIESHARWPYDSDVAAWHRLTRLWQGQVPGAADLDIDNSAEWYATVMYTPDIPVAAGTDVYLQIVAAVSETDSCPDLPMWLTDPDGKPGIGGARETRAGGVWYFRQLLKVHYGEAALPKFDSRWVYGDLHYHGQGTDNEGESGLSYRTVLQSMKAMGLDFAFATEHASNSGQVTDIDYLMLDNLPDSIPAWLEDLILDFVESKIDEGLPYETSVDALRDMSPARFAYLLGALNGGGGANGEILSTPGLRAPQLFLGGEVDAIPEISATEKASGLIRYGFSSVFDWRSACTAVPSEIRTLMELSNYEICGGAEGLLQSTPEGDRWKLRDVQALTSTYYARQHLLHLPTDPTRADAFVASDTTIYGGGWRRLKHILEQDYAAGQKGYTFLAHPANAPTGTGYGRMGPDIIPYSDIQLTTAFQSPYVLGLQTWNEDRRLLTEAHQTVNFPMFVVPSGPNDVSTYWSKMRGWHHRQDAETLRDLHVGSQAWDKMLMWSINPAKRPSWVPAGQVRKVFMAGGSDAHGDLAFRRIGAIIGTMSTDDTAMGKPRNLLYVGASRPVTVSTAGRTANTIGQSQIVDGLRSGNFSVTDGPALRIVVDANRNGVVDDTDPPMGSDYTYTTNAPLLVSWRSTTEFGAVKEINLYVGIYAGAGTQRVYATRGHGADGASAGTNYPDTAGRNHEILADGYVMDPTGKLTFTVPSTQAYSGTRAITLTAAEFPAFEPVCTTHEECEVVQPGRPPVCYEEIDACTATNLRTPTRMYVRAFARSESNEELINATQTIVDRFAFTNPIWLKPGS